MKQTIELTGDVERDIQRLEEIKAQISKERLDFLQREPQLRAKQRDNFFKKLFLFRENPVELRRTKIMKVLNSEKFKRTFYGLQKIKKPLTWYEKLTKLVRTIIHNIDERFRKKTHIELLMDRIAMMDEMSILEKRVKMSKYGIDPMLERDLDEEDKREMKNQNEELMNYRKELGDFLKDDPEYVKLRDEERKMQEETIKNIEAHRALWDQLQIKPEEGQTDPRYGSFSSELPNDLETPQ